MAKHEEIIANQEALTEAANQSVLALDLVKSAIERSGTEVADGTPVSEYGGMIDGIYEAGQQDVLAGFTNNYTRTVFEYCFNDSDWSGLDYEKTIKATSIIAAWQNYKGEYIPANMDCSNITIASNSAQWTCRWASNLKYFPDIKIPVVPRYGGTWQGCSSLETIEIIRSDENSVFDASFGGCTKLKNVDFDGTIGQNISFSDCKYLTKDSIYNVFNHLSSAATGKTATFDIPAITSAFGATTNPEWTALVATKQNWTISLV